MTADTKKWAEEQERERKETYEKHKEEHISYYQEIDDDRLLEEVARKLPGCSDEMCCACHDNEALINEVKRRMKGQ